MTEIRLDRANRAKLFTIRVCGEGPTNAVYLDRIAKLGACAVRLQTGDRGRIDAGVPPRPHKHLFLRGCVRSRQSIRAAILIDCTSFDDRVDVIPVFFRPV
ncbi:hypothetical protein ABE386_21350 [Brevibacillus brevis]|nr:MULTISPECIES: hypothetical protein [Brevibacillus]